MPNLNLTNQFLIAMPALDDPNFSRTVTYVCAHNDEGAMGIVINRPLNLDLGEVLSQMELEAVNPAINEQTVFQGGPVHRDRGFILHSPAKDWGSTIQVTEDIAVSTSRDILAAMSRGEGPAESLVALGYAGWDAGQLEEEMAQNAWLSGPADPDIIFKAPPEQRWLRAAALMGVDLARLSSDVGHA
ncbi:MAG: YqgE/AlgH family protein [Gammaproteobacteria bacterium]|nr:YqgE/AlgH family protein [Gammaproteobacteria bacterium]